MTHRPRTARNRTRWRRSWPRRTGARSCRARSGTRNGCLSPRRRARPGVGLDARRERLVPGQRGRCSREGEQRHLDDVGGGALPQVRAKREGCVSGRDELVADRAHRAVMAMFAEASAETIAVPSTGPGSPRVGRWTSCAAGSAAPSAFPQGARRASDRSGWPVQRSCCASRAPRRPGSRHRSACGRSRAGSNGLRSSAT